MLVAQELKRVFQFEINKETITLEDPNSSFSANDVREMYTAAYPELLNSSIVNKGVENDKLVYEFKVVAGTKG